jgi:tetratricopeptide (TPR) repeat protein
MRVDQVFRDDNGKQIPGFAIQAFIHNRTYFLSEIKVFQDGMVDCWDLVTFERFKFKVESGWVVTAIPEGAEVGISGLCNFKATDVHCFVAEAELIKEVADAIEKLNGRPDSAKRCREALKAYKESPGEESKGRLREAYEAVPAHRRMFLGDQDSKDIPIRMIIYGDASVEDWSHRKASKDAGLPPPTINTKEYLEEVFPSEKRKLSGALEMGLASLYRGNGLGLEPFPRARYDEVEKLFREGLEEEGLRAFQADLEKRLASHGRRPVAVMAAAGALAHIAEYLERLDRIPEAVDAYLRSLKLNPDGLAEIPLAILALKTGDAALAKALASIMREFGLEPLSSSWMAKMRGLDVEAFRRLLG